MSRKNSYRSSVLLTAIMILPAIGYADGEELSPAEQAAIAAKQAHDKANFIDLCYHTILNAPENVKQPFIQSLGNKTCEEAAESAVTGAPEDSE